jgi:hypothetical protein
MGVNTSSNSHEENFENIETDKEYEATLAEHFNQKNKTDSDDECDETKNEKGDEMVVDKTDESKSDSDLCSDSIYCIILDDEPIFYMKETDKLKVRNCIKNYAKKICARAKRRYTDLNFYIDEFDDPGVLGITITTLQKFLLFSYDNLYCSIRAKKLSTI